MNKKELIIQAKLNSEQEQLIASVCTIRHKISSLGMYIVDVPEDKMHELNNIDGIHSINPNTCIMAQVA